MSSTDSCRLYALILTVLPGQRPRLEHAVMARMQSRAHKSDSEDLRSDKLAYVAGQGWPPDQGRDLPVRIAPGPHELRKPFKAVVRRQFVLPDRTDEAE